MADRDWAAEEKTRAAVNKYTNNKLTYKSFITDSDPGNFFGLRQEVAAPTGPQEVDANGASQGHQQFLQKQANGTYVDTSTGLAYSDQYGQSLIANPNVAQQAAADTATRQQLLSKLAGSEADASSARAGQGNLIGQLDGTINGSAPSVAAMQLHQSQDAIARQQQSLAAGASGVNAFAARRQAAMNIGNAQTAGAGQAAIERAGEVQNAQGLKANVLSNMAGSAQKSYDTNLSGARAFGQDASGSEQYHETAETAHDKAVTDAENANNDRRQNKITGIAGKVIGSFF